MNVWCGLDSIYPPLGTCMVAIGVFDGLHVGHQALISAAVRDAREQGRHAAVFTFDRHPAELLAPEHVPGYLTTPEQRARIFSGLGVDDLVIARFDERLRDLSPEAFLRFVVKGVLGAEAVYVGSDFHFGRGQEGDTEYLREAQERLGIRATVLEPVLVDGEKASSSRVRSLLREGDLSTALAVLGHAYALVGTVVEGQKLGRRLGFPTANIRLEMAQVVPADGIYAVWVDVEGSRYRGACSIGVRPTVGGTERTLEVYLLDFDGDLYGRHLSVEFVERLRDELKFDSLEALVEQMGRDVEQARDVLGGAGVVSRES